MRTVNDILNDSSIDEGAEIGCLNLQKLLFNVNPETNVLVWNKDNDEKAEGDCHSVLADHEDWKDLEVWNIMVNDNNQLEIHVSKELRED